ncbi:MAG: hypothetical protein JNL72_09110 [Flavipsychrobacter sp.]|nr:hypothetical protein [Flavipsychrobacter sp.]
MDFEKNGTKETGKMTPDDVLKIYKKHGREISPKQAALILEFAHRLATIAVAQCLRNEAGSEFQEISKN